MLLFIAFYQYNKVEGELEKPL